MSSKFNPSNTPRQTPPWCKTAVHANLSGLLSPMPTYLNGYAQWYEDPLTPPAHISETFCMSGDGTGDYYSGSASDGTYSLALSMTRIPDTNQWEILLNLSKDGVLQDHESWHNFLILPNGLFDTGWQTRYFPPPFDRVSFQAAG